MCFNTKNTKRIDRFFNKKIKQQLVGGKLFVGKKVKTHKCRSPTVIKNFSKAF